MKCISINVAITLYQLLLVKDYKELYETCPNWNLYLA